LKGGASLKGLSQLFTIMRGSIGGDTFLANQYHQIVVRARTSPVNPSSGPQTSVRSAFSQGINRWNTLAEDVRELWDAYANTCQYNGPLGNYHIPGRLLFIATYTLRAYVNLMMVTPSTWADDPPSIPGFLSIDNLAEGEGTPTETSIVFDFTNSNGDEIDVFCQRSIAFNQSRKSFKGPWIQKQNDVVSVEDSAAGSIEWTGLTEDMRYFTRFRAISHQEPYRISNDYFNSAIAQLWTL
jgi:hypothetical protein